MKYSRNTLIAFGAIILTGCGAPNITNELKSFSAALDTAEKPLKPSLDAKVNAQIKAARDAQIATGKPVYIWPVECQKIGHARLDVKHADCGLKRNFAVNDQKGSAIYYAEGWDTIRAYETVLSALATSKSPAEIGAGMQAFMTSANGFAAKFAAGSGGELATAGQIKTLGSLANGLSEAARASAMKKLVNNAHEPLKLVITELIAHQAQQDGLQGELSKLETARIDMAKAEGTGNTALLAKRVKAYETAMTHFQKTTANSHSTRLTLVWRHQELLHAAVNAGGDPESVIAILEDIKALVKSY